MQDGDAAVRRELVLPVDDHLLVGGEPGIDQRLAAADLGDLDGTHLHRTIGIDHIGEGALLPLLHGRSRDRETVVAGVEQQPHVDQLARPEPVRGVGELGLEADRAGRLQDLVVDERELAGIELHRIVLAIGLDRELPLGHLVLNARQVRLRQSEDHRDRLDLRDHHQAVRVGGMDDVADIDLAHAGDPVDG